MKRVSKVLEENRYHSTPFNSFSSKLLQPNSNFRDLLDLLDHKDHEVNQEPWVFKEKEGHLEKSAGRDQRERMDLWVSVDRPDQLDFKDFQGHQA